MHLQFPKVPITTFRNSAKASASRIANGLPATENQIPHQCAILSPVGGAFAICGGSIISNEWVLTGKRSNQTENPFFSRPFVSHSAAHCTVGYTQHNLRFGAITATIGGQVQTAFGSISHPEYDPETLNNDISVIQIPTPLTFSPAIQSIRLPTNGQLGSTFVGNTAVVSGWGATSQGSGASQVLNWANMRVISNTECRDYFEDEVVADTVLCATGSGGPTQGHCSGDSGGPLSIAEGGVRTLIGVVSFSAAAGCDLPFPSGYTRTANYIHWIYEQTGIPVRP